MTSPHSDTVALLRERLIRMEQCGNVVSNFIPTGQSSIDHYLTGGLERGAVHEFYGAASNRMTLAKPSRFVASALANIAGPVLWVGEEYLDVSVAGIRDTALNPGRLLCVTAAKNALQGLCAEILHETGIAALVIDMRAPPSPAESNRLYRAAKSSGVTVFLLLPQAALGSSLIGTSSTTQWHIGTHSPASTHPASGGVQSLLNDQRWNVELLSYQGQPGRSWAIDPSLFGGAGSATINNEKSPKNRSRWHPSRWIEAASA